MYLHRWPRHRCEGDHLIPYARGGPTDVENGGPGCGFHNPFKNTAAAPSANHAAVHTYRPDNTEIGWPNIHTNIHHLNTTIEAMLTND